MSIFKPKKHAKKKDLVEQALRDLDPSLREQARIFLEQLDEETLANRKKLKELLKRRKLIY